ncbi:ABC transporter ATP-binding protein [Aeromicrobium massiliense]|uniref:ABC transporter ATP-binding protein n=1 Tax=Aeromicrobium massiliense TaxID=1464554 RepID=UPI00057889A0|nr:ATP-binding cassette domain-containing protein [Aeromicrobium massiliense]
MVSAPPITVERLTKRFGAVTAVDDLSFTVEPGRVTGFLGPNGSGKTTTLRMVTGLARPTSGQALVGGQPYAANPHPARLVGTSLEAAFHPGRSALNHLRVYAPQVGVDDRRCHELLELVGLAPYANRRVGGFSLGMRQRLGLATALLGDPPVVILDEPANGLDPQGIVWMRSLLRAFAAEGRTVLVSSHVLGEVQHTVDDVVVIARGRLVHASPLADLTGLAEPETFVRAADPGRLAALAAERGWTPETEAGGVLLRGVDADEVGAAAFAAGIELRQLTDRAVDLENVFLRLTADQEVSR